MVKKQNFNGGTETETNCCLIFTKAPFHQSPPELEVLLRYRTSHRRVPIEDFLNRAAETNNGHYGIIEMDRCMVKKQNFNENAQRSTIITEKVPGEESNQRRTLQHLQQTRHSSSHRRSWMCYCVIVHPIAACQSRIS